MNEIAFLVDEDPEGGYTACAIGRSIFTEADTMQELENAVHEALHAHFENGIQQTDKIIFVYNDNKNLQGMEDENKT